MNTPNNKRRRDSQMRIEKAFVQLLQDQELEKVGVAELCREAGVNRSTFYANYVDIYDLAEAVQRRLEADVLDLYQAEREGHYHSFDFLRLFQHIKENQLFYKTYFKLGDNGRLQYFGMDTELADRLFDGKHIEYHIEFFRCGLNAVIRKWLEGGCREQPEEIDEIIRTQYAVKLQFMEKA